MMPANLKTALSVGETVAAEFKRCGNGIDADTYVTVCSFLNRFGGDIYLGVDDSGTVCGVPEKAAPDIVRNFIKTVSNPEIISPTVYLAPEIVEHEDKTIVHIRIPPSSEVHSYKKVIYDRVDDADVKVTATGQIAMMYIRKQNIYTERKVLKYIADEDLRLDRLPRLVQRAINHNLGAHPWASMSTQEILRSARLITKDAEDGFTGYNIAAVMLLGRDDVIKDVCPTHRTDALLRKVNADRYDDRLLVETNLIDSFDLLMGFAEKHLWDKFYLEGDTRVSLRNAIAREMLVNSLMHREVTSTYIAKFIIERDRMYTKNANRAASNDEITPGDFEPNPKNPIIAAFFRNIGLADELGSGVRNLYHYVPRYSGKSPKMIDGDVFRIIVPLDDEYLLETNISYSIIKNDNYTTNDTTNENYTAYDTPNDTTNDTANENYTAYDTTNDTINDTANDTTNDTTNEKHTTNDTVNNTTNEKQRQILKIMSDNPKITAKGLSTIIGINERNIKSNIKMLKNLGLLEREGATKNGRWIVKP